VYGDGGFERAVVLASLQLAGERAGKVEGAAQRPLGMSAHLHLDVVELAALVACQHVEHDLLAMQFGGVDMRIEHLHHFDWRLLAAHGVDQVGKQVRCTGKNALEDEVVLGVEQRGHGAFIGIHCNKYSIQPPNRRRVDRTKHPHRTGAGH
jgi:hypothetical protein